jgi:hypothetical protein
VSNLKEELHGQLQAERAVLLSKLEYGLLGESFGHPAPESLPWIEDGFKPPPTRSAPAPICKGLDSPA